MSSVSSLPALQPSSTPSSPASPNTQFSNQASLPRSFINLSSSRSQPAASPAIPLSSHLPSISLEPPSGSSYVEFIRSWTDSHVARWLADVKCGSYAPMFKAHDIRGDIVLDLDQVNLMEMGVTSIGDRLRILNAVKALRQRVLGRNTLNSWSVKSRIDHIRDATASSPQGKIDPSSSRRRLDVGRPAPLRLQPSPTTRSNLPDIVRDHQPDSARTITHAIRPLPQPGQLSLPQVNQPASTPVSAHSIRSNLPPVPPLPRGHPPPPPSCPTTRAPSRVNNLQPSDRRTPVVADSYTHPTLPVGPQIHAAMNSCLPAYQSAPDSRAANKNIPPRTTSPLPPRGYLNPTTHIAHGRNGSLHLSSQTPSNTSNKLPPRPSTTPTSTHPYANAQAALQPPSASVVMNSLSPIAESFMTPGSSASGSPSPPSHAHSTSMRSIHSPSHSSAPSLGDLRWKLVKFILPDEGLSFTIDVTSCANGVEVLEKVLKKFGKGSRSSEIEGHLEPIQTGDGGLTIDGWGVYLDGEPLTEAELMSICHAPPDHPSREPGLTLRRTAKIRRQDDRGGSSSPSQNRFFNSINSPAPTSKSTKRASTISVLSGLGVRDLEHALDPPSPTSGEGRTSPAALSASARRPSKLRNFFGQRPPSELITNHLTEYFPFTEKKVLQRTARNSMMLRSGTLSSRRDSAASFIPPLPSRFSSSTQGSGATSSSSPRASISSVTPLQPERSSSFTESDESSQLKAKVEDIPRMSLSTEDGHSVLLDTDEEAQEPAVKTPSEPQLLPPIPFPSESFSESLQKFTAGGSYRASRPSSRAMSIASRRMSYMTELRSKRDRSDTASMVTVDEITAEVESRRESNDSTDKSTEHGSDTEDGWTRVGTDDGQESSEEVNDEFDDEEEEDSTLQNEDVPVDAVVTRKANKWIKGALIGAGSFGKVYLGMDASTGFLMAVKQVELPTGSGPNEERKKSMLSALEREIELLKNLQHENIVQYLSIFTDVFFFTTKDSSIEDEHLNIFLEYVPGGSVTALLRNYGAFEEPLVKNFVRQILEGLNYLHERDIIHRDIKGANILVDNKGGIKISDFGISKKVDATLLGGNRMHRPSLQGSVFWMAPEVVKQSGHTRKADIWSVGCLIVEMLTGEHPWAKLTQMQAIFKIGSSEKPSIPSDISADAQDFLQRTFELNYESRPSATELLRHVWIGKTAAKGNVLPKDTPH
ncbi:hypothetical protein AMATHDRAFT_44839 [Amanita thiersii Skay4041]|uniref:Protein kinase domain-containing protein n=1 Tax=Amanita thiersii Skay4041 TaxID=703135 RepID=A0A2A9NW09_9AGAR|nr:hypothetical protein AMATHDRAFT_44839 [Amanita thiersii Skay4041]